MNTPCVTVLMPVYNAEKYLAEAIDSILQQTFTDFEFLILDDGSTDGSVRIIRSYSDSRIRLLQNETNAGITATLNKGIERAKAPLIARMDADDISYPARLQRQYDFFRAHPHCGLLSAGARTVTSSKESVGMDRIEAAGLYYHLNFQCLIHHPTVMYPRQVVLEAGGYATPWAEDYDLWWRIARKYPIHHLPEVLLDYRLTDESLCKVTRKQEYEAAHNEQVLRNIRYYTGKDFQLTPNEVACLGHQFESLLGENKLNSRIRCLRKLAYINRCILEKENVNADPAAITQAASFKLQHMISRLRTGLSPVALSLLYLRTGYWWQWLHHKLTDHRMHA
ncbi:glycosyltransferase [Paraflavisolibacter sp. H34]|uniref:glycosyltransferase family 2 protein n=1 Tax=Huijunlia imazamoxiresistens TaxID=3127457 RepID=UPI003018211B